MASFASSATTCGARKHAWTKKVGENDGQLRLHLPPRAAHASRLDQNIPLSVKKLDIPYISKSYTTPVIKSYFCAFIMKHPVHLLLFSHYGETPDA